MTEDEWLNSPKWSMMLRYCYRKMSDRKLRLFACACCRRIWHLLPHDVNRALVAAIEDQPDGSFDDPVLNAALTASSGVESLYGGEQAYWVVKNFGRTFYKFKATESLSVATVVVEIVVGSRGDKAAECSAQIDLIRDLLGNPFRPVSVDPAWLTWNDGAVPKVARMIYDERRFDEMPILADALEEAGCSDNGVLTHCRGAGPHVRGCWLVDALLGN